MTLRFSVAAAVLGAFALVDAAAALVVWRRRLAIGRFSLSLILIAASTWCGSYALELITIGRVWQEFWGSLEYVGTALLPPAWLVFVLEYTGHRDLVTRRLLAVLALEPATVLSLLLFPATHDLIRHFAPGPLAPVPVVQLGALYWPHFAYTQALVLIGTVILVVRLLRASASYRRQSGTLATAVALASAGNVASSLRLPLAQTYDPTPVAVSLGALVLVWGTFRYRLLDLLPVARGAAFDRIGDPILVVDAHGRVVDRNSAALSVFGERADIGTAVQNLLRHDVILLDATASGAEVSLEGAGGTMDFELVVSPLDDRRGRQAGRLVQLRDISARKAAERRLRRLADVDGLTGLPNRRHLMEQLDRAIVRAGREGGRGALLVLGLDRFSDINESLGHAAGDQVLTAVGQRLSLGYADGETAGRLGGDQFALVLPGAEPKGATLAAREILAVLAEPVHVGGHEVIVTASAGLAVWPGDGIHGGPLFRRADTAMHRAKARGRNRIEKSDPLADAVATGGRHLGADLRHAIGRDELFVQYQPLVDLAAGRVTGVEALVRWRHPRRGVLPPSVLLPVAEEAGLIVDVDRWVLVAACGQAARWSAAGQPVPLHVNVSAEMFRPGEGSAATEVARALQDSGLDPAGLVIEINEQTVAETAQPLAPELDRLRDQGVQLALDDFGAGHTSLTHLRSLPIGMLKIDVSLVADLDRSLDDRRIVDAATALAQILDLTVVAEGVERPEQAGLVEAAGCHIAQGFLYSRPMDADDVPAVLGLVLPLGA